MRLDLLLKCLCLAKTRSEAAKGINNGKVRVGGKTVKPSKEIKNKDILQIRYPEKEIVIEIIEVPDKQVPRNKREQFYRIIKERDLNREGGKDIG
ncbi:hypothetical protein J7M07_04110 [bacterium]|nr:hypothetical protein [bacterium]